MKKYDVVVARYKENIDWLKELDKEVYNIRIYNKGLDDIRFSCRKLENVGGDAHTYVNYIVENYHALPDYVVFIQGDPFDHCKDAINKIKSHTTENLVVLSDHYIEESINGWYEHCLKRPSEYPVTYLRDVGCSILGNECPSVCKFGAGQQYIINSDLIKNRSLDFYLKLLGSFKQDYLLPWHLERLFLYVYKAI